MSYDIYLCDPVTSEPIEFAEPHQMAGGTHELGGTKLAWLNVTYNYGKHYYRTLDPDKGIRVLYEMTGAESLPLLEKAAAELGDDVDATDDYWEPTEGNAKRALLQLAALARMRPDGVWKGD